jgi:hypothetical protein
VAFLAKGNARLAEPNDTTIARYRLTCRGSGVLGGEAEFLLQLL